MKLVNITSSIYLTEYVSKIDGRTYSDAFNADSYNHACVKLHNRNKQETIVGTSQNQNIIAERPSEQLQRGDWKKALHGCVYLCHLATSMGVLESVEILEDSGILHEFIHHITLDDADINESYNHDAIISKLRQLEDVVQIYKD